MVKRSSVKLGAAKVTRHASAWNQTKHASSACSQDSHAETETHTLQGYALEGKRFVITTSLAKRLFHRPRIGIVSRGLNKAFLTRLKRCLRSAPPRNPYLGSRFSPAIHKHGKCCTPRTKPSGPFEASRCALQMVPPQSCWSQEPS